MDIPPALKPIDRMLSPFHRFLHMEASGGILLVGAAIIAMIWANSPWAENYHAVWNTRVTFGFGDFTLSKPLLLWINDALMAIFFFVVGLEIKRELLVGELSGVRKALLPVAAALGGMLGPALIYFALNPSGEFARGWGIPMATDIAFVVGILALLGPRIPLGLKVFLVALAIVDDIGAVLVIAVFYTENLKLDALGFAGVMMIALIGANLIGVRRPLVYLILGMLFWLTVLASGVHATVAGVASAMAIPASVRIGTGTFRRRLRSALERLGEEDADQSIYHSPQKQNAVHELEKACELVQPPLLRLEHSVLPWVSFLIIPIFALANAGVSLGSGLLEALTHRAALGIALGLFIGKQIGIMLFTWLVVKLGFGSLPENVTYRHIYGASCLAGIGFTMSLFIAGLAFGEASLELAKVGILAGSLISAILGVFILLSTDGRASRSANPPPRTPH